MPVNPTYPGLYIEEVPSSAHTITPAPTSIAVFIGYTHPFQGSCAKNGDWNKAIQIFNFTDYERIFGGLYVSSIVRSDVADAVYQFFLNGGTNAYVVALQPKYVPSAGPPLIDVTPAVASGANLTFTAKQLTDATNPVSITIRNVRGDTADLLVTFGSTVEQYRNVKTAAVPTSLDPDFIANRLAGSNLVSVAPQAPATVFPAAWPPTPAVIPISVGDMAPPAGAMTFYPASFLAAMAPDSSLDKVDIFNLLVIPGVADNGIWSAAIHFCDGKRAFYVMDPPVNASADDSYSAAGFTKIEDLVDTLVPHASPNGALYFPYLDTVHPLTGSIVAQPPSGFVAGIYARTDTNRGVWKAPAGLETSILNTVGVVETGRMTDMRQGKVNPMGVNVLRSFPGSGTVVWGARTVGTNGALEQWRYVPVRRTALFIEQTLLRNLGWVVFEPNDEPLWGAIRTSVGGFMYSLFRQGAFFGQKASDAFRVQCDSTTTTTLDIDQGIVNIVVAFRPLKPAEFVVIKIAQIAGQVQVQ
jgi:phage tail sheath protein FI